MPHSGSSCSCLADFESLGQEEGTQWLTDAVVTTHLSCSGADDVFGDIQQLVRNHALRHEAATIQIHSGESDEAEYELLVNIPFASPTTVHALYLLCADESWPSKVKAFSNMSELECEESQTAKFSQELDVIQDPCGNLPHRLRIVKFKDINSLQLRFEGPSEFRLQYIGLKGVASGWKHGVVETIYEARPNISDHEVKNTFGSASRIL